MNKKFMPEMAPDERFRLLRDNCDGSEETTYLRDLTQEDLDIKREQLSSNLIDLYDMEEELSIIKDGFKQKMKPLKDQNSLFLQQVKTRKEQITGMLYSIADHENSVMETFDEQGDFVSSRRLRPEEKQLKAFPIRKVGNQ